MESKDFYASSSLNKDKKAFLSKLKEEKKTKELIKDFTKQALHIQRVYKSYIQRKKFRISLKTSLISRLKDINSLKTVLKKPDFKPPLPILLDLLRDISYLCLQRSFISENIAIIEEILSYLKLSLLSEVSKENPIKFLCEFSGSSEFFLKKQELLKIAFNDPKFLRIRLLLFYKNTVKTLIRLMTINLARFSAAVECLTLVFCVKTYKNLEKFDFFFSFLQSLLETTHFFDNLRKIFTNALIPLKKLEQKEHGGLAKLLNLAFFPIEFFFDYGKVSNFHKNQAFSFAYEAFIRNSHELVMKVFTIARCGFFLRFLEKPCQEIKAIFQGFFFQHFPDPESEELHTIFLQKFAKFKNEWLFLLGNCIEILDFMLEKGDFLVTEHFCLLELVKLGLCFVTPSFLKGLLGFQWSDDKDLWYLRGQFLLLLSQAFAAKIFDKALELKEQAAFSDKFNPFCATALCEIYSALIIICYRTEETHASITRITNVLALHPELLNKVYSFIQTHYGFHAYLQGKLSKTENRKLLSLLIIYIMGYINNLFVTDKEDFLVILSKSSKTLSNLIKFLISLISKRLWLLEKPESSQELSDESLQYEFITVHGSKLLQLFYEFNQKTLFLEPKEWSLPEEQIKALMNEVFQWKLQHLPLLRRLPFSFPFEYRLQIFMMLLEEERNRHQEGFQITIRRECLFEDGFHAFQVISKTSLKSKLRVFYIDEFGMEEKGVDGGGIFKEFLNDICKIVFDPSYGLFKITEQNQQLYPNPAAKSMLGEEYLEIYSFVGSLIGRALYDNILIGMMFSPFFLRKWLGKNNFLNELQSFDNELYNNLKFLKTFQGDAAELGLTFTVVDENNSKNEIELISHGKTVAVDNTNKFRYIYSMANYKLNETTKLQTQAFLLGLQKVLPMNYLQFFDEYELQMVLSGALNALDIEDLKRNVDLKGYSMNESYMKDFWKILSDLDENDKNLFVKFVTACERPPLLGFAKLIPKFTIQMINSEGDKKLPTSATCFNKLNLPKYSKKEVLKEKLLLAIRSAKGFYLT